MRMFGQFLAVALAIAALVGFGALATGSMHSLERKQQHALDADIDWIVAHRRKEVAKMQSAAVQPQRPGETNGTASSREETRRVEPRDVDAKDKDKEEARAAIAQARKTAKRNSRNAARRNTLLPRDFGALPLFTVETLLGLR